MIVRMINKTITNQYMKHNIEYDMQEDSFMNAVGFDNQKYLTTQSEQIRKRIAQFGGKLYLEFGGKLFDDFHASRVLPGFEPDSKIRMLQQLKEDHKRHRRI